MTFAAVGNGFNELWVMNANGTHLKRLTVQTAFAQVEDSAWAPNGKTIAFTAVQMGTHNLGIWTIHPDGTGLRELTNPATTPLAGSPSWSPNGAQLAFSSAGPGYTPTNPGPISVWLMNADGTNARQLSPASPDSPQAAVWSPDGKWLAYQYLAANWETTGIATIYRINADGTNPRQLTSGFWDSNPVISPDGSKIIFGRDQANANQPHPHIFVMSSAGAAVRRLPLAQVALPFSWAPKP